jgi:hypothetical protein
LNLPIVRNSSPPFHNTARSTDTGVGLSGAIAAQTPTPEAGLAPAQAAFLNLSSRRARLTLTIYYYIRIYEHITMNIAKAISLMFGIGIADFADLFVMPRRPYHLARCGSNIRKADVPGP